MFRNSLFALAAITLICLGFAQPAWSCDGEEPVNPECPDEETQCEPYTNIYNNVTNNQLFICVDVYVPITININNGGDDHDGDRGKECEYKHDRQDCDFCRRWMGCFDPNTNIVMGDKSTKMAVDIKEGDLVWNPIAERAARVTKRVAGPEELAMIEFGYGDKLVKVTQDHPVVVQKLAVEASLLSDTLNMSSAYTVKQARDLSKDDSVLGSDGQYHRIDVLRQLPLKANQAVINFELEGGSNDIRDHAVVANGIISGDLAVQNTLTKDKSF
jgi:hypothetical protein